MNKELFKTNNLIMFFTLAYILAFTANGVIQKNYEFLYYTVLMVILIYITLIIDRHLHLASFIIFNMSLLGFMHLLAGNLYLFDVRLYDVFVIPGFFRFDNLVHTYATFIATVALYSLLSPFVTEGVKKNYWAFATILVLMAIGLGSINEVVEFLAVVVFDVQEEVGGYFNNSLDLVFNLLGSILATVLVYYYLHRPKFIKKING